MTPEPLQRPDACPIKEDMPFQKMTWIVERAGWVLMLLIVAAAFAGLFGGPTTREESRAPSGRLHVSYQHFQRHLDPTEIRLAVETRGQSLIDVAIDKELAQAFEMRSVVPRPIEMQAHEGGVLLRFAATPKGDEPARITLMIVPNRPGLVKGAIGLLDETPAPVEIFTYP